MSTRKLSFREALLDPEQMSVTWELVPGRGAREEAQESVAQMAELAARDSRINSITLTDNPSGKPAILPYPLALEAKELGIETLIHFTCKDKNRNDIESELHALARSGLPNLLVMTGDYTTEGFGGRPKPVFDLDAVQALRFIRKMNNGFEIPAHKGSKKLQNTDFFAGAVVSPFKSKEAELMAQYYKMHKKIAEGAQFIVTQLGYDARKFDELKRYMDWYNLKTPLVGNIFVLSLPVAKMMNKNLIPGCVVTDKMVADLEAEKAKGNVKEQQLLRSAKLYAIFKGLKYNGVTIAGHGIGYTDVKHIIEKGEELSANWLDYVAEFDYPQDNGFYFFEKDPVTGLNTNKIVDRSTTGARAKSTMKDVMFSMVHHLALSEKAPLYPMIKKIAKKIDKSSMKKPFTKMEYWSKSIMLECRFCGDCVMHELAYTCPMSQCAKHQRNGACGGSRDGWCEVYPEKQKCIYVTMYEKFKNAGKEGTMKEGYIPPVNWDLYRTSSWLNFFAGRDYNYRKDVEEQEEAKSYAE